MATEQVWSRPFAVPNTINLTTWGIYLGAGAAAGAVGGLIARLAMRIVAVIVGNPPGFSLAGTLLIVTIFTIVGLIAGIVWMGLERGLHVRPALGTTLLAAGLVLLVAFPVYQTATGDLSGASTGEILRLLLLFLPVPLTIAWGTVRGARWLGRRAALTSDRRLPLASALATALLAITAFISALSAIDAPQRHPILLSKLLDASSADFSTIGAVSRSVAFIAFIAYLALALAALWRQPENANVRLCVLLVLALPTLLLAAGSRLPTPLGWLPDSRWAVGLVQAAGLAALLGFFLIAGGFTPPRWILWAALVTWAAAALWLVAAPRTHWTEWVIWSMLAATFACVIVARLRDVGYSTPTLMLALFAACWLGLWVAILLLPSLQLRLLSAFAVTLTVSLFGLPWLLLPAALLSRRPQ